MKDYASVTILVVEDDEVDAMAIQRAFKKCRLSNTIHRVKDGVEALGALRGTNKEVPMSRPFIVLLDLNMPRMNGLEFLAEVRADPKLHDITIFVLTTSKADEDRAAAFSNNVAGYIVKSDVGQGFMEAIEMLTMYWRVVELPT